MQLGIHIGTFHRRTLDQTLDAVLAHDLKTIHFHMTAAGVPAMPEKIDEELSDQIVRALAVRDITMATLSGTFNMIHPNIDARRAGLRRLGAVVATAPRLGTSRVTLCTGTRDPNNMWRGPSVVFLSHTGASP